MKKLNYLFLFVLSILFFSCNEKDINSENNSEFEYKELISAKLNCMNIPRPVDSYNYPVYPGVQGWAELGTVEEMITACQVPENVLKNMSTQAVIQAIWEYPFFEEIIHRFQYQMDFERTFFQNNAYKELIKRNDAGIALLERLEKIDPLVVDVTGAPKALEVIMSQTVFLAQLTDEARMNLIEITLQKDNLRQSRMDNDLFRSTVWLLIGNTFVSANYSPFIEEMNHNNSLISFMSDKNYVYMEEIMGDIPQIILHYAQLYLNN